MNLDTVCETGVMKGVHFASEFPYSSENTIEPGKGTTKIAGLRYIINSRGKMGWNVGGEEEECSRGDRSIRFRSH